MTEIQNPKPVYDLEAIGLSLLALGHCYKLDTMRDFTILNIWQGGSAIGRMWLKKSDLSFCYIYFISKLKANS